MSDVASKLARLGFSLPEWCVPPSETLVRAFETRFSLVLPADYRAFLLVHGGVFGDAECGFMEPTPCGPSACIDQFYGFTNPDRSDNIARYLEARRTGALPKKPAAYAHVYRLAESFHDFIERLEPAT